eukprot:GGOE01036828.1.p1 GENE.GGOE01036828.1~~GGOE01036828.1.p1  ORF type:complete len:217 (-),score=38.28 GGOE01036828.1:206-856(-)
MVDDPSDNDIVWTFHDKDKEDEGSSDFELSEDEVARIPPVPPSKPLDCMAPLDMYLFHCDRYCVVPNSRFAQELADLEDLPLSFDLSTNYIGPIGMLPVLELCATIPTLTALNAAQQQLTDRSTQTICEILQHHTHLQCVDLSGNLLGVRSARMLLRLLNRNPAITHLDVQRTYIAEDWQRRLARTAELNAVRLSGPTSSVRTADNPEADGTLHSI